MFLDITENGFGPINLTISLIPFVVGLSITYIFIRLLALGYWCRPLWIALTIILAVPTTLSMIKLNDQQMNKVDPLQHKTLEENLLCNTLIFQHGFKGILTRFLPLKVQYYSFLTITKVIIQSYN
ncbi:hypothetical protein ACFPES_16265 [Paenibacillus sp. GCM10023248]|uniref:hypothetical protein n=1 Tax=Bacillales TaxID=1385 RepID=UPI00237944CE|nr:MULTISPECIES: hypothetical protein [Bacillales]MDD9268595.1 hypothetical protein [Paenibacillus sp. MAHUQ-63]MDR6879492.1 hypothetical protein [Bacillus sp. 3255]